jgi:hypothetical protein
MAFDWIESHRGLRDHPKTVNLAAAWADRKPCVLGHLHELWWWTLEYAPDGVLRPAFLPQILIACEWHGRPERFWSGLLECGFLESADDGAYTIHDWELYATRRLARLAKDATRKRDVRGKTAGQSGPEPSDKQPMSGGVSDGHSHARARAPVPPTYQQTETGGSEKPPVSSPTNPSPFAQDADAQGAAPTASAPTPRENGTNPRAIGTNPRAMGTNPRALEAAARPENDLPVVHAEAGICPLCRVPYLGSYLEHTSEKHAVRSQPAPGNLGSAFGRRRPATDAPPPEVEAQFAAMHERLQSLPSDNATA